MGIPVTNWIVQSPKGDGYYMGGSHRPLGAEFSCIVLAAGWQRISLGGDSETAYHNRNHTICYAVGMDAVGMRPAILAKEPQAETCAACRRPFTHQCETYCRFVVGRVNGDALNDLFLFTPPKASKAHWEKTARFAAGRGLDLSAHRVDVSAVYPSSGRGMYSKFTLRLDELPVDVLEWAAARADKGKDIIADESKRKHSMAVHEERPCYQIDKGEDQ